MGGFGFGLNLNTTGMGLGAGINVGATVSTLVSALSAPEQAYQQQQTQFNAQASALNNLNTLLGNLQTAVNALQDPLGAMNAVVANSSNSSVLTATTSAGASLGTHSITVGPLATTSTYDTNEIIGGSASTPIDAGSVTITLGNAIPSSTPTVQLTSSNATLGGLAAAINAAKVGVTANVITDANGARLSIVSNTSGAPGNLNITSSGVSQLTFTQTTAGANGSLTVDGTPVSVSSNTVTGVIPGVTLNLMATSATPVSLTVTPDTSQATNAINSFVSAYNAVLQAVNQQFTYTPGASSQPPLFSDNTLAQVQQTLATDANYVVPGSGGLTNLASFGINLQQDGTLSVDSGSLSSALSNNFSTVQNFFQQVGSQNGFAVNFSKDLLNLTSPASGAIALDLQGVNQNIKAVTDEITNFQAYITQQQQQLTQEFSQVNATLETLPVTLQQINSQLSSIGLSSTLP